MPPFSVPIQIVPSRRPSTPNTLGSLSESVRLGLSGQRITSLVRARYAAVELAEDTLLRRSLLLPRLSENAHLSRFHRDYSYTSSLRRTSRYASFRGISKAVHLGIFRQPLEVRFFDSFAIIPYGLGLAEV